MIPEYPESEQIIQLKNLTLNYGDQDVIRNVDLNIPRKKATVILGPSGVGKSTILKAILGVLKPAEGSVFIRDEEISTLSERELVRIRLQMAMVFQNGALFDSMSVSDNVSFRMRERGLAGKGKIEERVNEVLQFVGMQGTSHLFPAQLSGGMKKRVAIARALAPDPEIFLFDEPTVGLDPVNRYNIERIILELKEKPDVTMVIVTHDVDSAIRLADFIVLLHEGSFIFKGDPEDLGKSTDIRVRTFMNPDLAHTFKLKEAENEEHYDGIET